VLDTGLDPVRIVAASPDPEIMKKGGLGGRKIIVASEYEQLTRRWLEKQGVEVRGSRGSALFLRLQLARARARARRPTPRLPLPRAPRQYTFLRAYGATESLPPEDADVIVDNAATGATLAANQLKVFDTLLTSTTRLFASKKAWADPVRRARIEMLAVLLQSVLDARRRVLVSFNCPANRLDEIIAFLPAMKKPTVSSLCYDGGFAISTAAETKLLPSLIPRIKEAGGTDLVVLPIRMLVA